MHLQFSVAKQLPIPSPTQIRGSHLALDRPTPGWIANRVDRLNAWPHSAETRAILRAELDAAMFHVYGIARDDGDSIMETFPIVKRKDLAAHGEYRTKRLILEAHDAMSESIRTGARYRSPFAFQPTVAR